MTNYRPLLGRMQSLDAKVKNAVVAEVAKARIGPGQYRDLLSCIRYDVVDAVRRYLKGRPAEWESVKFGKQLDMAAKEPLKHAYYGMVSFPNVPLPFLGALDRWEQVYFFAGAWRKERARNELEALTLFDIAALHLKEGIADFAKLPRYEDIKIVTKSGRKFFRTAAFAARILGQIEDGKREQKRMKDEAQAVMGRRPIYIEARRLLIEEMAHEGTDFAADYGHDAAMRLDSCSDAELRTLTDEFGAELLGGIKGYAK